MSIWDILEIEETTDIKKIRYAYAARTKECHVEVEPEKFQELYGAYQKAIAYAKAEQSIGNNEENTVITHNTVKNAVVESVFDDIEDFSDNDSKNEQQQGKYDSLFEEGLRKNVNDNVKKGIDTFKEYFLASGRKDWKQLTNSISC